MRGLPSAPADRTTRLLQHPNCPSAPLSRPLWFLGGRLLAPRTLQRVAASRGYLYGVAQALLDNARKGSPAVSPAAGGAAPGIAATAREPAGPANSPTDAAAEPAAAAPGASDAAADAATWEEGFARGRATYADAVPPPSSLTHMHAQVRRWPVQTAYGRRVWDVIPVRCACML